MQTVTILGRQPALGLAELESRFGAENCIALPTGAAIVNVEPGEFPMPKLGGTIKAGKLLTELPFTDWQKIAAYLVEHIPKHTDLYDPGKLTFGISAYGFKISPKAINATALSVKKAIRATGRPVRVVPNTATELNSAQVLHNNMTDLPLGMELLLVRAGNKTILGQTVAIQNIEAYAARDQKRPKRDARVGMLPPKLAQIIVNLSVDKNSTVTTVLDPFCGTGVVLQEALLMGYAAYGTDLEQRMIDFSQVNLQWLADRHSLSATFDTAVGDATNYQWQGFDTIACETYLGQPFSAEPKPEKLRQVMQDVDTIHRKFLKNVATQTESGFRMTIAVPAWKTHSGFKHLKTLDSLEELGYNRVSFAHVRTEDLLYYREDQIVARELVVLIRK